MQRLLIVKYNLLGDTISAKTYGNDLGYNNSIIDYQFDTTNHIYILQQEDEAEEFGYYKSKMMLQKYSLNGNLIWTEKIQASADTSYTPHSLGLANDTCIFVTANRESELGDNVSQLYAYNSDGSLLWKRDFDPDTEIDGFTYDIFVHNDTAFLFEGSNYSNNLVKVDINNNITVNNHTDIPSIIDNVQLTPDNNLLITTYDQIAKTNLNGTKIWSQDSETDIIDMTYNTTTTTIQDSAGNIYATRQSYRYGGYFYFINSDFSTTKYDSDGNIIWQNKYDGYNINRSIVQTIFLKNGQVYVGGSSQRIVGSNTDSDYIVVKIDAVSGTTTGVYRYLDKENEYNRVSSLAVLDNGNVVLTGISQNYSQYDWTTQLLSDVVLHTNWQKTFLPYPNPIKNGDFLTILGEGLTSYSIISPLGQVVREGVFRANNFQVIEIDHLASGMYVLVLQTDEKPMTSKIIVE